jgi:hypothetical protein
LTDATRLLDMWALLNIPMAWMFRRASCLLRQTAGE